MAMKRSLRRSVRHGVRLVVCVVILLPLFIIAEDRGKLDVINCSDGPIHITSVYLTCDSAGAYYYGAHSYRNSDTCKYGDTVKVNAYMELRDDFSNDGVDVSIDAGIYNARSSAIDATDFCGFSQRSTNDDDDNSASCPSDGYYHLKATFTLKAFTDDKSFHYTPDLRLRFYNYTSGRVIGCAVTGTRAQYGHDQLHAEVGLIALGIGLLLLGTCFGLMLYLAYRRKKLIEKEAMERRYEDYPPSAYIETSRHGRLVPWNGSSSSYSSQPSEI